MSKLPLFTVRTASSAEELTCVRKLFTAYASSLPVDLSYQNFDNELSTLPGLYTPPTGCLLLAVSSVSEEAIGCVALRPLPGSSTAAASALERQPRGSENECPESTSKIAEIAEMKRLYCVPESRGSGVGRVLVEELLREAVRLGYREVRLDTLPSMGGARKLYESLGFQEVPKYYDTPVEDTVFLGKRLERAAGEDKAHRGVESGSYIVTGEKVSCKPKKTK